MIKKERELFNFNAKFAGEPLNKKRGQAGNAANSGDVTC
jgi:hypothetical protein